MTTAAGRRLVRPDAGLFHHRQRAAPEPHRAVVGRPAPAHRGADASRRRHRHLICAKHSFVAAMMAISPIGGPRMRSSTSSTLNSEQDLASIPMAQGGLSRLAVARLESAGVPAAPLLRRVGLTPE
jgi:hypothetical protein